MKTLNLLVTLALFAEPLHATMKQSTTSDLDLKCQGEMTITQIGQVEHYTKSHSTRNPEPHYYTYSVVPVEFEVTQVTTGCGLAQKQFQLPFEVEVGSKLSAYFKKYGDLSQEQALLQLKLGQTENFNIKQNFYSATSGGTLPIFPLYHVESITFEITGDLPKDSIEIDLTTEKWLADKSNHIPDYKFFDVSLAYGVPTPNKLSESEKLVHIQKIIDVAEKLNLNDAETLKIVDDALGVFQPKKYDNPTYQDDIKKYFELIIPVLNKATSQYLLFKSSPKPIQSVFEGLQHQVHFGFLPPFGKTPEDIDYAITLFVKMPLALQAQTGNVLYLKPEMVEMFLTKTKAFIEAFDQGTTVNEDLAPYSSLEKVLQLEGTVAYIKKNTEEAIYAPSFPLNAQSLKLISEILAKKH